MKVKEGDGLCSTGSRARARRSEKWKSIPGSGFWELWGASRPEREADRSLFNAEGNAWCLIEHYVLLYEDR
jgi:hypothetical protein